MRHPPPLPDGLDRRGFDRADAQRARLRSGRLRRSDLVRPFSGVYASARPTTLLERARAYAARLKPGQVFSHATAAVLLGIPIPEALEQEAAVHVSAVRPADAPHARGVTGHRVAVLSGTTAVHGLPVADAPEVFCQLGAELSFEDLVVVADYLLNSSDLEEAEVKRVLLDRIGTVRRIGSARLLRAVRAARAGSASPAETRIRLVLEAAGIAVPEQNGKVFGAHGHYLGKVDFIWRAQRVILEYEGDGHRERGQFRFDVARYEALADEGWRVLRATGDDLTPTGRRLLARRVAAALA